MKALNIKLQENFTRLHSRYWVPAEITFDRTRWKQPAEERLMHDNLVHVSLYRVWLFIQFKSRRAFLQREALGWLVQLNCCTWLPGDEIQLKERKRLWGPQCSSPLWKYKWIGCQMHCSVQSSKTQSALQSVISSESHVGNVVSPHKEPRDAAAGFLFSARCFCRAAPAVTSELSAPSLNQPWQHLCSCESSFKSNEF